MIKPGVDRKITPEELAAQDKQRPWFVVRGEVYDGTPFLKEHPGGADSILLVAGEDASEDFIAIHSADGRAKLANVRVYPLCFPPNCQRCRWLLTAASRSTTSVRSRERRLRGPRQT